MYTKAKTPNEIAKMRAGGKILAEVLQVASRHVKAGITTKEISKIAEKETKNRGVIPAFLGYQGFPEAVCISINDEVVHGIPSQNKKIADGDIVSLDFGVIYEGMIVDGAVSQLVGGASKELEKLLVTTEESLKAGLKQVKAGCHVGDIGWAIEQVLKRGGYGIVTDLVGHGVGHALHEEPNIPNFGKKGSGPVLEENMTIAVEPMATLGDESIFVDNDGWTIKTQDGSSACHFEHTVLVTKNGCEILTTS